MPCHSPSLGPTLVAYLARTNKEKTGVTPGKGKWRHALGDRSAVPGRVVKEKRSFDTIEKSLLPSPRFTLPRSQLSPSPAWDKKCCDREARSALEQESEPTLFSWSVEGRSRRNVKALDELPPVTFQLAGLSGSACDSAYVLDTPVGRRVLGINRGSVRSFEFFRICCAFAVLIPVFPEQG